MKECAGYGDQTQDRLHAKRTRFQSSYRARGTRRVHPQFYMVFLRFGHESMAVTSRRQDLLQYSDADDFLCFH